MKRLFVLLFVVVPIVASAQVQFGYLSYKQVLMEMPEYTQAMQELQTLKAKYNEEATRGEAEFQKKFIDFFIHNGLTLLKYLFRYSSVISGIGTSLSFLPFPKTVTNPCSRFI